MRISDINYIIAEAISPRTLALLKAGISKFKSTVSPGYDKNLTKILALTTGNIQIDSKVRTLLSTAENFQDSLLLQANWWKAAFNLFGISDQRTADNIISTIREKFQQQVSEGTSGIFDKLKPAYNLASKFINDPDAATQQLQTYASKQDNTRMAKMAMQLMSQAAKNNFTMRLRQYGISSALVYQLLAQYEFYLKLPKSVTSQESIQKTIQNLRDKIIKIRRLFSTRPTT